MDTYTITKPRTDDRLMYDILQRLFGYQAVLVAYELKMFSLLAERPRSAEEVCAKLNLSSRPGGMLLTICASLGLVEEIGDRYSLTPTAEDYLVDSGPSEFSSFMNGFLADPSVFSYESVKNAFLTDKSQVYEGEPIFEITEEQADRVRGFTHMMHGHSMAPAHAWPDVVDLGNYRTMLDIGGGSGAHTIGAVQRWPDLRGLVFDMAPVCEVAEEYIAKYKLKNRIATHVGDMWSDDFPQSDIHFYSNIFHDWLPSKGQMLAAKSFESLESGGRIVIHEMLYNDEKTGPFTVASFSVAMLLWSEGQQYSGHELSSMLSDTGFVDVEVIPTFGYWSIVTGRKP